MALFLLKDRFVAAEGKSTIWPRLRNVTIVVGKMALLAILARILCGWQLDDPTTKLSWIFYRSDHKSYIMKIDKHGNTIWKSRLPDWLRASAGNFDETGNINLYSTTDEPEGDNVLRVRLDAGSLRVLGVFPLHIRTSGDLARTSGSLGVTQIRTENVLVFSRFTSYRGQLLACMVDQKGKPFGNVWKLFPSSIFGYFSVGGFPTRGSGISYDGRVAFWENVGRIHLERLDSQKKPIGSSVLLDQSANGHTWVNSTSISDQLPFGRRIAAYAWVEGSRGSCADFETSINIRTIDSSSMLPRSPRKVIFSSFDDCGTADQVAVDRKGSFIIYSDESRHQLLFEGLSNSGEPMAKRVLATLAAARFVLIQSE